MPLVFGRTGGGGVHEFCCRTLANRSVRTPVVCAGGIDVDLDRDRDIMGDADLLLVFFFLPPGDLLRCLFFFLRPFLVFFLPRSTLGLRLLLTEARRFFFLVFFVLAPRMSGVRERDLGVLEIDRGSRARGGGEGVLEMDLGIKRGRATTGDLERCLLMDRILGPLDKDLLSSFLRNGNGERLRPARNRGEGERLLLKRRGGSGLSEIDNSRRRSGVRLRVRLRLRVLERGLGVTSLPKGSFITRGRFSITVRTS